MMARFHGCCSILCALALLSMATSVRGAPETVRLALVQPGYPGSAEAAKGFLAELSAYIETKAGLQDVAATYHNLPDEALKALQKSSPHVAVVSLGFYLEHRKSLKLTAHLEARPELRYTVVAKRGTVSKAADLAGQAVTGGALYEAEFLRRIVFSDKKLGPGGVASWKKTPTLKISRALRHLERGRYRAVVLNGRELRSVEELGKMKNLEKIVTSEYYPPALVVTVRPTAGDPRARRIVDVLRKMASAEDAKELMTSMGCEEFRPVRSKWLEELERKYDEEK